MVQRAVIVRHERDSAAVPPGDQATTETTAAREVKRRRRRADAMAAIKARMLRCSEAKADHHNLQGRRFKRGYRAPGCGAVDSAVFYLACLVCTPPRAAVVVGGLDYIGVEELG